MGPPARTPQSHHNQPRLGWVGAESARGWRSGCVLCFCIFLEFWPAVFFYGIIKLRPGGRIRSLHPVPAPWTDADKTGLVVLKNAPIKMADTLYGRFLATQNKRDAKRAYQHQHMDAEEREAFLRKLTEIDANDAEDGQSPPSNPTPV